MAAPGNKVKKVGSAILLYGLTQLAKGNWILWCLGVRGKKKKRKKKLHFLFLFSRLRRPELKEIEQRTRGQEGKRTEDKKEEKKRVKNLFLRRIH